MGKGDSWTQWTLSDVRLLEEMVRSGMTWQEIHDSGKFPGRTYDAIRNQIKGLGSHSTSQKKFLLTSQIDEAEIVELDTVVKRFVDAFNKICSLESCNRQDLERFRIIFSSARVYFDIYFKLHKFEEVESRVERVEKLVEQLEAEKKTKAPKPEN